MNIAKIMIFATLQKRGQPPFSATGKLGQPPFFTATWFNNILTFLRM